MKVGVVDIGTNSMRMLVTDGVIEDGRWVEVTGLGRGVDRDRRLSEEAMARTLEVLSRFGLEMTALGVEKRYAMATSATRDAANRDEFLDRAERALGVRPEVISGVEEGRLSFDGARSQFTVDDPVLVSDIGGGSTELVIDDEVISVEMGSVRLTDRMSPAYPLPDRDRQEGLEMARSAFAGIDVAHVATHIGVAGTWTSLAAIAQGLPRYEPAKVHGYRFDNIVLGDNGFVDYTAGDTGRDYSDPRDADDMYAGDIDRISTTYPNDGGNDAIRSGAG